MSILCKIGLHDFGQISYFVHKCTRCNEYCFENLYHRWKLTEEEAKKQIEYDERHLLSLIRTEL
jgi:hypothetical protein